MNANDIWTAGLTIIISAFGWVVKDKATELQRVTDLLNRTREEMARDYVTKGEVHADINRILDRLDKLGEKLDRIVEMANAK